MDKNIVILHGWASRLKNWEEFKNLLIKANYKVFMPVLPGFGEKKLTSVWDLENYNNWLEDYLKKLNLKSFCLLGHSFGGSLAINYSGKNPKNLTKLILISSSGLRKKYAFKKVFFLLAAKSGKVLFCLPPLMYMKEFWRRIFYRLIKANDYYNADKIMKGTLQKVLKQDLTSALKKIRAPALIIWGRKDKDTPLDNAFIMNKEIKGSKLIIYDKAGHRAPFEKSKEITQEIKKFY